MVIATLATCHSRSSRHERVDPEDTDLRGDKAITGSLNQDGPKPPLLHLIDDLLAGSLRYVQPALADGVAAVGPSLPDAAIFDAINNPWMSLLQASFQLRKVTMSVLCEVLQIGHESRSTGAGR